jgi:hypothetical protein
MKARAQVTASAKTATAPAAARMPQPPAAVPDRADDQPDVAAQLASASRLGHNFAALGVDGAGPPPLQPKLVVGPVGDRYEREADWVVGHALSLHNGPAPSAAQPVQRQEEWNTTIRGEAEAPGEGSRAPEMRQENRTGLPDNLKAGLEHLSGMTMNDVRVHYNSPKPARLQALAYTQGTEIHMGRGQERHLPHEAWHVVQQKQGRVKPTMQTKGVAINDDEGLEREANVMGEKLARETSAPVPDGRVGVEGGLTENAATRSETRGPSEKGPLNFLSPSSAASRPMLQRMMDEGKVAYDPEDVGTKNYMGIVYDKFVCGLFNNMNEDDIEKHLYRLYSTWEARDFRQRQVEESYSGQVGSSSWNYGEEVSTTGAESAYRIVIPLDCSKKDSKVVESEIIGWIKKNPLLVSKYKFAESVEKKSSAPDPFIIYTMINPDDTSFADLHNIAKEAKARGLLLQDAPFYTKNEAGYGYYTGKQPTQEQKQAEGVSFGSVRTQAITKALEWLKIANEKGNATDRETFDDVVQRTDIHVGPGQERHLPDEAWHAVQQKQGRVKPTGKVAGLPLNDSKNLEREADMMGSKAVQMNMRIEEPKDNKSGTIANSVFQNQSSVGQGFGFVDNRLEAIAQRKLQGIVNNSSQVKQLRVHHEIDNNTTKNTDRTDLKSSTKISTHSFSIRNKSDLATNNSELILQRAEDLDPQYCQQNNEWYAVHMTDSCFQHFQQDQHQNVIDACIQTLANNSGSDWTAFNQTTLAHNGWTFVCTWIENDREKYLGVYHADRGYKEHRGEKEDKRDADRRDRFNREPAKDPFGGKDPSNMSSEEYEKLFNL